MTSATTCETRPDEITRDVQCDIFREYLPYIQRCCRMFSLQPADADDVTQTVALKLLIQMQTGSVNPTQRCILPWLKTVTHNTVCSLKRQKSHCQQQLFNGRTEHLGNSTGYDPADVMEAQEEHAHRQAQLKAAELDVFHRVKRATWEAYRLSVYETLPTRTIAGRIGVSVNDVYVAKCRVIQSLRRQLLEDQQSA